MIHASHPFAVLIRIVEHASKIVQVEPVFGVFF